MNQRLTKVDISKVSGVTPQCLDNNIKHLCDGLNIKLPKDRSTDGKRRFRSPYTFANINLLGKCNVDCYFCLGKDLEKEFSKYDQLTVHYNKWKKFDKFLDKCREHDIKQIYITGQNTDSLLYKHLDSLVEYLHSEGFFVGLRTNGFLAEQKMNIINKCSTCMGDAISYSIHSLISSTQKMILGRYDIPNWGWILNHTKVPMRVSIVLTRYNVSEFMPLVRFLSKFDNIRYIQVRKVSTETRKEELNIDMELFEKLEKSLEKNLRCAKLNKKYEESNLYYIYGKEVSFWRTVTTTANSINYFTNGVLSEEYFIIEGYAKQKGIILDKNIRGKGVDVR